MTCYDFEGLEARDSSDQEGGETVPVMEKKTVDGDKKDEEQEEEEEVVKRTRTIPGEEDEEEGGGQGRILVGKSRQKRAKPLGSPAAGGFTTDSGRVYY